MKAMKKQVKYGMLSLYLVLLLTGGMTATAQGNDWEVPGDHFSLEGALELFKKSASPEEFEQLLNSAESKVNNLDLNEDGMVDYIKVIDRNEGNIHAFILQAVISDREYQDVAVIELEKLANGKAILQITGDEDVYGIETIIEPTEEVRVNAGTTVQTRVVNVWAWPSVRYVYSPYYSVWVSPWRYSLRPVWWSAWGPVAYYEYYPRWNPYRPYYSVCYSHRISYARQLYRPYRTTSIVVYNHHNSRIADYRSRYDREEHYDRRRGNGDRSNDRHGDVAGRDDSRNNNRGDRGESTRDKISGRDSFGPTSRTKNELKVTDRNAKPRSLESPQRNETIRRPVEVTRYPSSRSQDVKKEYNNGSRTERNTTVNRPTPVQRSNPKVIQRTAPREVQRSAPREIQRSTPREIQQNSGQKRNQPMKRPSNSGNVSRQSVSKPSAPVIRNAPSRNSGKSVGTVKKKKSN